MKSIIPVFISAALLTGCSSEPKNEKLIDAGFTPKKSKTVTCYNKDGSVNFSKKISAYKWYLHADGTMGISTSPVKKNAKDNALLPTLRTHLAGCIATTSFVAEASLNVEKPYVVTATLNGKIIFKENFTEARMSESRLWGLNGTIGGVALSSANLMNLKATAVPSNLSKLSPN